MPEIDRDNYYILLELDFDPPVTDAGKIKTALRTKKQEWTRWQDNPGKRNMGLNYLGQASEIEKVLLDPVQREKEADAAKEIKRDMLAQFEAELRVLESKGYILPREASAIANKYKTYGVDADMVGQYAKCPVADSAPQKDEDDGEALDRMTARNIQRNLKILGHPTLYAFLGEPPYSSVKKLLAASEQKRRSAAAQGNKSSQATITQELAGICASMFETIQSKQKYDRYIKVSKYPAVNELIDEEFARSQFIAPDVLLRIVNFTVEKYGIKILEAEEYAKGYCAAYGIPVDTQSANIPCPSCGTKTPRESAVCTACAQPIKGSCPSCGEDFENGQAACSTCGFSIKSMSCALEHISEAESALIESNWSTAQRHLQYVKKYWPNHPKLELLEKRTLLLEERYSSYIDSIEDCIKHGQLYAAQDLIQEADARHLKLPATQIRHVASQIAAFEYQIEKLQEKEIDVEQLLRLSGEITDSIELNRLLSAYPPEPPPELAVTVLDYRSVSLSWGVSASPYSVVYTIVRKCKTVSLTAMDGDLLYEGPANSFVDKTADPLTEYYYSVYSKRAGTFSRSAAVSDAVMLIPEVERLRVLPLDGGAQLTWAFNPDVREIQVSRKLGGDEPTDHSSGILLANDRLDGLSDSKLKNEVEYWYFVSAVYVVDGKRIASKGVCESVVPRKTVAPIEDLNFVSTDAEGVYIMSWNAAQHPDILLFCSSKAPDFKKGDIMPVDELLIGYRKLDLDYKRADSAQFTLGVSGGLYLFAASVFGRFATVCEPRYIVSVSDISDPTSDIIGGDLYLNMKWPVGVGSVSVAYRFDYYPKTPDEAGATTVHMTREQYDFNAAVIIKEPEPNIYYMTIFSAFITDDGKKVYSSGVEFSVNNQPQHMVFYQFTYKKKRFSETGTLDVTISSGEDFVLPKSVIVGKIGRLPLSRADGLPLFELEKEIRVNGSVSLQFSTQQLPPNIYIRLFLHDDEMCEKLALIPASKVKIT